MLELKIIVMKLIVLGVEKDSTKELELFAENEFGFKATIRYNKELVPTYRNEIRHNLTEFHHLFDAERTLKIIGDNPDQEDLIWASEHISSAFESDIHCQGGTQRINCIEEIVIELDTEIVEEMYEYID
tara:strand:+ start:309 stop:695 length:387 start_codon:yes stop_codon:yes gene_type:complete